mmetsp:Transcript_9220/g.23698  ORF Transcript_9220/g.23698 Transcript_9220/m.23698 type:complete len:157 (-) Transcript_9220:151-621(-)|eukprot:CAMPEP_0183439900 /NCGR_PEP_ID=MMETSP0370-20130417/79629_1 /TAXON_ID=268820 /ORGANISM="Peridinium aciculiferum, Strain PAER-2" /LENGTH=156 /DNA_ID=CAMNT_0025628541 /DNA_START=60 /DNA_END=530 /DNA_ORIENTATION=-
MVRASLRKARNRKVVSRKPKDKNLKTRQIRDPALRKRYDKKKTLLENLKSTDVKEMYSDLLPAEIPKHAAHPTKVNEEEKPIIEKFVQKHGYNYDAMHWDIKLNVFQWTAAACKKRVLAWKKGNIRSAAAEILSGHGMDLRKPLFGAAKQRNVFGH